MKPCLSCGELSELSYCPEHTRRTGRRAGRQSGYTASWDRLSRNARRLQPWCSDCGRTAAEVTLSLDHSAESWRKVDAGKVLTLRDCHDGLLIVRCLACNSRRGPARGHSVNRT